MNAVMDHEALLARLGAGSALAMDPLMTPREWHARFEGRLVEGLVEQVGEKWRGFGAMSYDRRRAVRAIMPALSDAGVEGACEEPSEKHAYETGVILALAEKVASRGGRLTWGARPADDPVLRAIMAGFGRPFVPVQAYGPVAHWLAERTEGRRIERPALLAAARAVAARAAYDDYGSHGAPVGSMSSWSF